MCLPWLLLLLLLLMLLILLRSAGHLNDSPCAPGILASRAVLSRLVCVVRHRPGRRRRSGRRRCPAAPPSSSSSATTTEPSPSTGAGRRRVIWRFPQARRRGLLLRLQLRLSPHCHAAQFAFPVAIAAHACFGLLLVINATATVVNSITVLHRTAATTTTDGRARTTTGTRIGARASK